MPILSAPVTRSHSPALLERGVRMVFMDEYQLYDSGHVEEIYSIKGSEKKTETDVVMAGIGQALPKAEGSPITFDAIQQSYTKTYTHSTFALGLEFTEESIEDNLYLDLLPVASRELGQKMAYTRQVQGFDIFNDLTTTVYTAGGSNYTLLSTSHYREDGGTWSNRPTTATQLSVEALEERLQAWTTGMLDHRGLKYNFRPAVLMVGAGDEGMALRLTQAVGRPQSADNDPNALIRNRGLRVVVNPHLTDDGRWFLLADKRHTRLVHFDRKKAAINRWDANDSGNVKFRARMRISHGASGVEGISGSPG